MIKASALVSALYCAKNGVTFVIDHHSSPFSIENSLETIAKAFDRVGIAHLLCYEISDRDGEGPKEKGLQETDSFLVPVARVMWGCMLPLPSAMICSTEP